MISFYNETNRSVFFLFSPNPLGQFLSANVGLIFFYMLIILVIAFLLDIFIPGPSSTLQVIITFAFSIIPLLVEYVLYSFYEKNLYEENRLAEKNRRPIMSKNLFLFLGIFISLNVLIGITDYVTYLDYLNKIQYKSILVFLEFIKPVNNFIALLFFIFLLSITYKNLYVLKNSKKRYLNFLLVIGIIIVISKIISFSLIFIDKDTLARFDDIKVYASFVGMTLEYLFHLILFVYIVAMSYPNTMYKGISVMIFTMKLIFSFLFYSFVLSDNAQSSNDQIKNQVIYSLLSVLLAVLIYTSDLLMVNSYSNIHEVIDDNLEISFEE